MKRTFASTCTVLSLLIVSAAGATVSQQNAVAKAFQKRFYDSIGAQWYATIKAHANDAVFGTVHVSITLRRDGTIRDLHVMSNTANQHMAQLALDSIRHAKIPALPPELIKQGQFATDFNFTVYPD